MVVSLRVLFNIDSGVLSLLTTEHDGDQCKSAEVEVLAKGVDFLSVPYVLADGDPPLRLTSGWVYDDGVPGKKSVIKGPATYNAEAEQIGEEA